MSLTIILLYTVSFVYIYNIPFTHSPLSGSKLMILFMIIWLALREKKLYINRNMFEPVAWMLVLLMYSLINVFMQRTGDFGLVYPEVLFILNHIPGCVLLINLFRSFGRTTVDDIMHMIVIISFVQAIIIILSMFIPVFNNLISSIAFIEGRDNIQFRYGYARGYGLAASVTYDLAVCQAFAILFATLNLSNGVITQGLVKYDKEMDSFASSLMGLMSLCILSFSGIYFMASNFWNELFKISKFQMLMMFIIMWTTSVFGIWSAVQKVKCRYIALIIVTLLNSAFNPLLGIILILNTQDKVNARIMGIAIVQLICYTWLAFDLKYRGKIIYSKQIWKYALSFNIPLLPHFLSQIILSLADRIMIRDITTASYAGIYSLAYSVSSITMIFHTALMAIISPWIYKKIRDNEIGDIKNIAYITLILISIANLLLICFAPEAIKVFSPQSYYDAIWLVPPIAMGMYFIYTYDLFAKFAFYHDKPVQIMLTSVLVALLNLTLNWIFIQIFGYVAAAYTTLVCYIFYSFVHYVLMCKICNKYHNNVRPYDLNVIGIISLIFCVLGFLAMLAYTCTLVRYCIVSIIIILAVFYRRPILNKILRIYGIKEKY